MKIAIILLAAGGSRRLGRPKQLVIFEGKTLVRRAAESALAACENVVVALGAEAEKIRPELLGLDITTIENANWASGMAGSLRLGLAVAIEKTEGLEAAIFSVVDQPLLTAAAFGNLILEFEKGEKAIVASAWGDASIGPPVLFGRAFFHELLQLTGDEGAKKLLFRHETEVARVDFEGGGWDVDCAEDMKNLR